MLSKAARCYQSRWTGEETEYRGGSVTCQVTPLQATRVRITSAGKSRSGLSSSPFHSAAGRPDDSKWQGCCSGSWDLLSWFPPTCNCSFGLHRPLGLLLPQSWSPWPEMPRSYLSPRPGRLQFHGLWVAAASSTGTGMGVCQMREQRGGVSCCPVPPVYPLPASQLFLHWELPRGSPAPSGQSPSPSVFETLRGPALAPVLPSTVPCSSLTPCASIAPT